MSHLSGPALRAAAERGPLLLTRDVRASGPGPLVLACAILFAACAGGTAVLVCLAKSGGACAAASCGAAAVIAAAALAAVCCGPPAPAAPQPWESQVFAL